MLRYLPLVLLATIGCKEVPTQANVTIFADPTVTTATRQVLVSVYRLDSPDDIPSADDKVKELSATIPDDAAFPLTFNIGPKKGNESGAFWIEAEAYDGTIADDRLIAFSIVQSRFVEGRKVLVEMTLRDGCSDPLSCRDMKKSCDGAGLCEEPIVVVPDMGVPDMGVPGTDAGPDVPQVPVSPRITFPWNGTHYPRAPNMTTKNRLVRWTPVPNTERYKVTLHRCKEPDFACTTVGKAFGTDAAQTNVTFGQLEREEEFTSHYAISVQSCDQGLQNCGPPSDRRFVYLLPINDVNGDAKSDLVFASPRAKAQLGEPETGRITARFFGGASKRLINTGVAVQYLGRSLTVGDVNRDGVADVIAGASNAVFVLLGDTPIKLGTPFEPGDAFGADVAVGDIDGDGYGEILVLSDSQKLALCQYDGTFNLEAPCQDMNISAEAVHVGGDIDGDGNVDIALQRGDQQHLYHWANQQLEEFGSVPGSSIDMTQDFTNDGLADIVYTNASEVVVASFTNSNIVTAGRLTPVETGLLSGVVGLQTLAPQIVVYHPGNADSDCDGIGEGVFAIRANATPFDEVECMVGAEPQEDSKCLHLPDDDAYPNTTTTACDPSSSVASADFGVATYALGDWSGSGYNNNFAVARARTRMNRPNENWDLKVMQVDFSQATPAVSRNIFTVDRPAEGVANGRLPQR